MHSSPEIALREGCCIKPNQLCDREDDENVTSDVWDVLDTDFSAYCAVSTLFSLNRWAGEISQHETLTALVIDLLNPSEPHYDILSTAVSRIERSMELFDEKGWNRVNYFFYRRSCRGYICGASNGLLVLHGYLRGKIC
jgi:hypothetical protein